MGISRGRQKSSQGETIFEFFFQKDWEKKIITKTSFLKLADLKLLVLTIFDRTQKQQNEKYFLCLTPTGTEIFPYLYFANPLLGGEKVIKKIKNINYCR